MRVARVFPSRTRATPSDELSFTGPPGLFPPEVDEVHVSVTFSWDMRYAEMLAEQWRPIAPTKIGGPATGMPGGDFEPGRFVAPGYVITSRGCPNTCWFCDVWKRDGDITELPIMDGHNILDDNLLACSDEHVAAVFAMLARQSQPIEFTGGLEAARLEQWHVDAMADLKAKQMFFAYDTPDDLEPLRRAGEMLIKAGFTVASHRLRCYVLIGYPKDTFDAADQRILETIDAGFFPMAMLYRDKNGEKPAGWRTFQRHWARPQIVASRISGHKSNDRKKEE